MATNHYTFSGNFLFLDGVEYRFSDELGVNIGVSCEGYVWTPHHPGGKHRGSKRGPAGYPGMTVAGRTVYVHRMVYELFVSKLSDDLDVDHIDTNVDNCSLSNLRAVSKSGNMRNPITRERNLRQLGSVRRLAATARSRAVIGTRLSDGAVVGPFGSVSEACQRTGASRSDIARCAAGTRRQSGGYSWKYVGG